MPSGEEHKEGTLAGCPCHFRRPANDEDDSKNDKAELEMQQRKPIAFQPSAASRPVFQEILVGAGEQQLFSGGGLRVGRAAEQRF